MKNIIRKARFLSKQVRRYRHVGVSYGIEVVFEYWITEERYGSGQEKLF